MADKINFGVIGMSEGNGHPYSWAAIFIGFDKSEMEKCPFPAIPEYLSQQKFPGDFLVNYGKVTKVYSQAEVMSKKIAAAAKIETVVNSLESLSDNVDAILLARDDAENHYEMALPFFVSSS